jgi:hypothetical protein
VSLCAALVSPRAVDRDGLDWRRRSELIPIGARKSGTEAQGHGTGGATQSIAARVPGIEGKPAYTDKIPREQRRAIGAPSQRYTVKDARQYCYDHHITAENGSVTQDVLGCGKR